jgi:hypothetical protein
MQAPGSWAPPWPGRPIGGHHVRAKTGGHHRSAAVAGRDAWSLGGVRTAEQMDAFSCGSADGRGDHPRDARSGARPGCGPDAWADRDPVARRVADQRSAGTYRDRLGSQDGIGAGPLREGGKRRMVGMDDWGWEHVARWTEHRVKLPIGPLFCILAGPTRGRGWSATGARGELRRATVPASRHAGEHSLKHDPGERVAVPEMLTGLQRRGGATSMATSQ